MYKIKLYLHNYTVHIILISKGNFVLTQTKFWLEGKVYLQSYTLN